MKNCMKIIGWSLLYFVAAFAGMMLGFFHPFLWVYNAIFVALLAAWPYFRLVKNWPVIGITLCPLAVCVGLNTAIGEGDLLYVVLALTVGLLTEIVRAGNRSSRCSMVAGYMVFSLLPFSNTLRMWIAPEVSMQQTVEEMGQVYADRMVGVISPWMLFLGLACTLCVALVMGLLFTRDSQDGGLLHAFFGNARKPEGFFGKVMVNGMNGGEHARMAKWGLSFLNLKADASVLDVGCGGGGNLARLLDRCPDGHISGLDYSPVSVQKSLDHNREAVETGRIDVREGNVAKMPYADGQFDAVTAFETVYFWPSIEDSFREVLRVMKSGGRFMIVNEADGYDPMSEKWEKWVGGMRTYNGDELTAFLKNAGFCDVQVHWLKSKHHLCVIATKA